MNGNKDLSERLLTEARRLGDQLLAKAQSDSDGLYWLAMRIGDGSAVSFDKSDSIYAGVCGIVLFLLELYKKTGESRYLDASKKGMAWAVAYCEKNPARHNAFLTGGMGVSFTLVRMYETTREKSYLDRALSLTYSWKDSLTNSYGDDLLSGRAGIILGLLHLHAVAGESWLLETIDSMIQPLLEKMNHGPVGLYWDRSALNINGLCGLAHGATGVGFVFLELGHYFHNESFYRLAEQAFLYERYFYFHAQLEKNWPDLRKGIFYPADLEQHQKAFREGDIAFFTTGNDMNAWCHGAVGIGLSRLRACQLLPDPIYQEEARIAIDKTIKTTITAPSPSPSFTLCHGRGGDAELFLYAYQTFNQPEYLANAETVAVDALDYYEKNQCYLSGYRNENQLEDSSFFMGNAGIGYFLLRVLNPLEVPSILLPEVKCSINASHSLTQYPFISISTSELLKQMVKKDFQRTLLVCEQINPTSLDDFIQTHSFIVAETRHTGVSLIQAFIVFIEGVIDSMPEESSIREMFTEAFGLEKEKRYMDEAIKSFAFQAIKEKVLIQQAEELIQKSYAEFLKLNLILDTGMKLFTMGWNWNRENLESIENLESLENRKMPEDEYWPVLLKPGPTGISEIELTPFSYTILYEFQKMASVEQVIRVTIDAFETLTTQEEETVTGDCIEQIKQALTAGILVQERKEF